MHSTNQSAGKGGEIWYGSQKRSGVMDVVWKFAGRRLNPVIRPIVVVNASGVRGASAQNSLRNILPPLQNRTRISLSSAINKGG